jgi:hypothetical protein
MNNPEMISAICQNFEFKLVKECEVNELNTNGYKWFRRRMGQIRDDFSLRRLNFSTRTNQFTPKEASDSISEESRHRIP